jgi:hypothetical protein
MNLPDQLLVAISAALEDSFHPGDADKLLALGRALGLLGRLGFDEPDFLGAVQVSRDVLASRVEAVLAEARQEAGDDPVDPGCCWPSPRPWPRSSIRGTTRALGSSRTGRAGPRRFRRC